MVMSRRNTLAALMLYCGMMLFMSSQGLAEQQALVWPAPPETARIQYLKSIATKEDVTGPRGFFGKLWDFIVGPDQMEMRKPMSVALDAADGWLAVADPADKRVHVFDEARGKYWAITAVDTLRLLQHPIAVASDGRGNLYVSDSEQRQVHMLAGARELQRSYGGPDVLQRPTGVAVDAARGRLYVADTPAHVVRVFDLDSGALHHSLGARGTLDGEFNYPNYLAIDRHGQLYVTDALNGRIQVFDAEGRFLRRLGQYGDGSGDLSAPKGVALDSAGHLYVADARFDNIQIFDAQGRLLLFFGSSGQAPGMFWLPTGLAMGADDRLYVADSYNKRVQVFQYLREAGQP